MDSFRDQITKDAGFARVGGTVDEALCGALTRVRLRTQSHTVGDPRLGQVGCSILHAAATLTQSDQAADFNDTTNALQPY